MQILICNFVWLSVSVCVRVLKSFSATDTTVECFHTLHVNCFNLSSRYSLLLHDVYRSSCRSFNECVHSFWFGFRVTRTWNFTTYHYKYVHLKRIFCLASTHALHVLAAHAQRRRDGPKRGRVGRSCVCSSPAKLPPSPLFNSHPFPRLPSQHSSLQLLVPLFSPALPQTPTPGGRKEIEETMESVNSSNNDNAKDSNALLERVNTMIALRL